MTSGKRALAVALIAALVPARATAQTWQGIEQTTDGVTFVQNPSTPMFPARVIEPQEVWRLGGDSDADEEFFGVISDVLVDEERNFYILDTQLSEVKVYAESGEYLRTVGREGEGPGEFRRPNSMLFLPDGSLGVIQAFPSKMVLLSRAGEPIGDFPFKPEGEGFPGMGTAQAAGDQVSIVYFMSAPSDGYFERKSYLSFVGLSGDVRSTMYEHSSRMEYANSLCVEKDWNDFSSCWAGGRDGRVYARLDYTNYAIHVWNTDGALDYVIQRDYPGHARSEDDIEEIKSDWARNIARWVPDPKFDIEADWNPIENLYGRDDGSLWVRTSRGARDMDDGVLASFDVYDDRGRYVQELVIEGEFDSDNDGLFLDGDYVIVVTDLASARDALRGGGSEDDDIDMDAEPMEVICYQMPPEGMASGK